MAKSTKRFSSKIFFFQFLHWDIFSPSLRMMAIMLVIDVNVTWRCSHPLLLCVSALGLIPKFGTCNHLFDKMMVKFALVQVLLDDRVWPSYFNEFEWDLTCVVNECIKCVVNWDSAHWNLASLVLDLVELFGCELFDGLMEGELSMWAKMDGTWRSLVCLKC